MVMIDNLSEHSSSYTQIFPIEIEELINYLCQQFEINALLWPSDIWKVFINS